MRNNDGSTTRDHGKVSLSSAALLVLLNDQEQQNSSNPMLILFTPFCSSSF
jgi:hypothetical protein